MNKPVEIFVDGACRGNPGPGGWGSILRYNDHEKELSGSDPDTTNNRMELTAAIKALAVLKRPCNVIITTDSQYVRKGIMEWLPQWQKRNWRTSGKTEVKNKELWEALLEEVNKHSVQWHWVKGHSGHPENERADQLANHAIDKLLGKR